MNLDPTNQEHLDAIIEYLRVNGGGFIKAYDVTKVELAVGDTIQVLRSE